MAKELIGTVTHRVADNHTREIRVLAEETVILHPEHIRKNKKGQVSAVVVSPQKEIQNSCSVMIPIKYLHISKETRQYIASL